MENINLIKNVNIKFEEVYKISIICTFVLSNDSRTSRRRTK